MCGIAGYFSRNDERNYMPFLEMAVKTLNKRGPDFQKTENLSLSVGFAHARLSIIDTSPGARQPMHDTTGRYKIIFNGEIFNFRELKKQFLEGIKFRTTSDTEVLLNLYVQMGKSCLQYLNGFFAFAIFDNQTKEIFLARDRFGIKPLLLYSDENLIVFASELKAIFSFPIQKEIDFDTLALYLQLNYVPGANSILKRVQKLAPAHCATIDCDGNLRTEAYYQIPFQPGSIIGDKCPSYNEAKTGLKALVQNAVNQRLVSDVPLGTFLSGGIDSSIVTACAAKQLNGLSTFSIGYKDEPYFDETVYANLVAKKFNTNHTVFPVSNDEMFSKIFSVLDYIDEPFADSSAIAVYVLSELTRRNVTVALSGDGGDELFAGYNKHAAELKARRKNMVNFLMGAGAPVLDLLPRSRHSKITNFFRQLQRYSGGQRLSASQRYWRWCAFSTQAEATGLIKNRQRIAGDEMEKRVSDITRLIRETGDLNDVLYADMHMVLPNDMLTKVDLMSMANSLEVRVPLLDVNVVNYAFSLPVAYKISGGIQKRILKDAFAEDLPAQLFNRPKHGFEVPLLKWIRTGLHDLIANDLLERRFVEEQDIFDYRQIEKLKRQIFSISPGDIHATVWGLVVFQYWYKKYFL